MMCLPARELHAVLVGELCAALYFAWHVSDFQKIDHLSFMQAYIRLYVSSKWFHYKPGSASVDVCGAAEGGIQYE